MSSFTGGSMGGGGGLKIRLKMPLKKPPPAAAPCAAAAAAPAPAPSAGSSQGTSTAVPTAPSPTPAYHAPPPVAPPASRKRALLAQKSASGRPRRTAAAGVASVTRLLAEEGDDPGAQAPAEEAWEPTLDDFREATPLPDDEDEPESPMATRRLLRHRSSGKRIADDYVDPSSINLDDEAMLYESDKPAEPKPPKEPKPPREPKPKKPRVAPKPQEEDDDYDSGPDAGAELDSEEFVADLHMEDDDDYEVEEDEEEFGRKRRRGGGAAAAGAAAGGSGAQRVSRSRRGAAAGGSAGSLAGVAAAGGSGGGGVEASIGTKSRRSRRGKGLGEADGGGSYSYCSFDDEEDVDCFDHPIVGNFKEGGDFRSLLLKMDHTNRPLWVCPDGRIFLETYSPIYKQAYDFLIAIAEPVCRPESVHEYVLTPHSLYAAVSVGLDTETIISVLNRLSKVQLSKEIERFIHKATENYGKVKLVLKRNKFWVESPYPEILKRLLQDPVIEHAREPPGWGANADGLVRSKALKEQAAADLFQATAMAIETGGEVPGEQGGAGGAGAEGGWGSEKGTAGDRGAAAPAPAPAAAAGVKVKGRRVLDDDSEEEDEDVPVVTGARGGAGKGRSAKWDDSMSESDPEDFSNVGRARGGRLQKKTAAAAEKAGEAEDGSGGMEARVAGAGGAGVGGRSSIFGGGEAGLLDMDVEEDKEKEVLAFEVKASEVELVKKQCLPPPEGRLNHPLLEEYDFKHDSINPNLDIELRPDVQLRPYQEKSLAKMFGNGRARSGIIVLPCGAGKSLVGVAAASRVKKSCLCLCTSSVSVDQWRHQFLLWTNLHEHQVVRFTSEAKDEKLPDDEACVCITTFTMISHAGKRSAHGGKMMEAIRGREWGLMLLDEVHVVPAEVFRKVIGVVKSHCKLGLTATLVREDEKIGDLNFLIGPKMYEANWLDLTKAGHIANVQCAEVWCPMSKEFFAEYLKTEYAPLRQLLYVMNPNKFMACQYLIHFHEQIRGDKVIVFSDNVWALQKYAVALGKPFIYGGTAHSERTAVLYKFKNSPACNTVFLSKVGDNSLDIPEANVLIQISSHAGSRRQEAQRLGRILRAKKGKPGSGQEETFNAFFYTLVSRDTTEMFYSAKRQQFLIDQGYAFKVVPNMTDVIKADPSFAGGVLKYHNHEEQLNLLSQVLTAKGSNGDSLEGFFEGDDPDDLVAKQHAGGRFGARKMVGNMAALSGGAGLMYLEYGTGGGNVGQKVRAQERAEKTKGFRKKLGVL